MRQAIATMLMLALLDGDRLSALTGHGMLVCLSTKESREHETLGRRPPSSM